MTDTRNTGMKDLQLALDAGDMAALRQAIRTLDQNGQDMLAQHLGGSQGSVRHSNDAGSEDNAYPR
jgi:hypothetical protein